MTIEDFQRNTRGVNDGKNFDSGYLERVYNEIRDNEIVMPEEHEGDLGFNYAWRELIKKTDNILPMENITTNGFDSDMFNMVWMPILESISYGIF